MAATQAPHAPRRQLDLQAAGRKIENLGELLDELSALDIELETELSEIDLRFPLIIELEVQRTELGIRVIGM